MDNIESRDSCPLLFLSPYFEASIDDVIGMTHRRKSAEKKLQIRNFIHHIREYHLLHCVHLVAIYQNYQIRP